MYTFFFIYIYIYRENKSIIVIRCCHPRRRLRSHIARRRHCESHAPVASNLIWRISPMLQPCTGQWTIRVMSWACSQSLISACTPNQWYYSSAHTPANTFSVIFSTNNPNFLLLFWTHMERARAIGCTVWWHLLEKNMSLTTPTQLHSPTTSHTKRRRLWLTRWIYIRSVT